MAGTARRARRQGADVSHLDRAFVIPKSEQREAAKARVCAYIDRLPDTSLWSVKVAATKPSRTVSQNRMLWALYEDILKRGGEAMGGWTREDLHEFFLSTHFGTEKKEVFGKLRQVPLQRSATLDRKQFGEFVDFIVRFMAQQGVVLGMPEGM